MLSLEMGIYPSFNPCPKLEPIANTLAWAWDNRPALMKATLQL
jgi:hypothetical protein